MSSLREELNNIETSLMYEVVTHAFNEKDILRRKAFVKLVEYVVLSEISERCSVSVIKESTCCEQLTFTQKMLSFFMKLKVGYRYVKG
jgi:hypothetical protein